MIIASFAFATAQSNNDGLALLVCAAMTLALVVFTFRTPQHLAHGAEKTRLSYLKERKDQVYENLRDLNFEFKAGKLPDADYQQLRSSLESEAAGLLAEIEHLESAATNPAYTSVSGPLSKSNPKGARS